MRKIFFFLCMIMTAAILMSFPVSAVNTSPVVIPGIQQWTGDTGIFVLPQNGRICYEDDALATTANVLKDDLASFTGIIHPVAKTTSPAAFDIFLTLDCQDTTIGTEGYLMSIGDNVTISANADAGVFYGTRTLLQILKQDSAHSNIPKGSIKDFPKYKERGFMLDVGRKYFTPEYLENYVRQMAWLKLNDFHLHFTDDQGFRLKSDNYPNLSLDQGYSKAYLRTLQDLAARYHVTITPEIDLPGHSSAIVSAYPETGHTLGTPLNPLTPGNMHPLDLSKDAAWNLAYGLLDEFVPLFDAPDFHIGADEYPCHGGGDGASLNALLQGYPELLAKARAMGLQTEADLYYKFINSMGSYVKTKYGKNARFWEWCERFRPYTSIDIDNNLVFDAWVGPEAINRSAQGFKIINSNWKSTYIVPGTIYYPDLKKLYEQWQPYWLDMTGGQTGVNQLDPNDPNLLGAKFHNWNDHSGVFNEGGLDRFTLLPLKVFAEDIWGAPRRASFDAFKFDADKVGNAPGHGVDLAGAWKFEEASGNYAFDTSGYTKNALINGPSRTTSGKFGSALVFDGINDTVELDEPDIEGSWTVSAWVNRTASTTGNAIILDSPNSSIKLEQAGSTNVGFTDKATSSDYAFNYNAPVGEWTNLTFAGNTSGTALYVNGVLTDSIPAGIKCPMKTIGAGTDSMNGMIDEVKVYARELDGTAIASLQNGMLMYLPFECSDAAVVQDASGLLYHGVMKAPAQRVDSGKEGKGIKLSNRNSEVILCHDDVSGPWTASIWVRKEAGSPGGALLRSEHAAIGIGSAGIPKLTLYGVAEYPFTTAINDDVWTNLTFTSDGVSQTSLYVNGEYRETINNTISLPLMTLGNWYQAYDGMLDELKVYDRVLGSAEISEMAGYAPWVDELTTNSAQLVWNNRAGAEGYNLYRSTNPDSGYVKINDVPITGTQYYDFGLAAGSTYYYRLSYIASGVEAPQSGKKQVTIPSEVLLSLSKPASAEFSEAGHEPGLANDDNTSSYWAGSLAPKWLMIDLMDEYDLTKVVLTNYTDGVRYYQYNIQASADGINWVQLGEKTNTNVAADVGDTYQVNVKARYVKANITYCSAGNYAHIKDFKIYGKKDISATRIPVNGIKGYWNFNEGSGNLAADTSGNVNNGTITGAQWTTNGKSGNALYFDGNDDNVVLAQTADITTPWTASMWVKREDNASCNAILMSSDNFSLRLEQYNGTNKLGFTQLGVTDYTFNNQAAIGKWDNVTFVGTSNGTSLYLNGIFRQFIPGVISCPMGTIGRNTFSLKGTLDDVRVYDRALCESEIRALAGIAPSGDETGAARMLVSRGKPATASNTEAGSSPSNANDGSKSTYWGGVKSGDTGIAWLQLDLEALYNIGEINVRNYVEGTRYYNYYLTASRDGINWTQIGQKTGTSAASDAGDTFADINITARYLRINLTNNSADPYSVHVSEFRAYGWQMTDAFCVEEDSASLQIGYQSGDSAGSVTKSLTLAGVGANGTTITWSSSDTGVVSNSGIVKRPDNNDVSVTLTASIVKGSATATRLFTVKVKKSEYPANIIAFWNFNEGSGTTASDVTGNGHNGTINGAVWSSSGRYSSALYFDGNNDCVNIGGTDISGPWTAAMWVKREDSTNAAAILLNSSAYSLRLEQNNNTNKVGFTRTGVTDRSFNYQAPVGEWVHLAFVGTTTGMSLYVNGVFKETIPYGISCPLGTIGRSTCSLKGCLEDVKVFGRALNDVEISSLASVVHPVSSLISLNKPATASVSDAGHEPSFANDSDASNNSYWGGPIGDYGETWWQVDLGDTYKLTSLNIRNWVDGSRYYKYYIRTSLDGINWTPLAGKENTVAAADIGDTFSVAAVGRYVRVSLTCNSVNSSIHISDFKVYGYQIAMPAAEPVSITDFRTDCNAYTPGNTVHIDFKLRNNTTSNLSIANVRIRRHGLTNPLAYDESVIASGISLPAGQNYSFSNAEIWNIPGNAALGAYGLWVSVELDNGQVYDAYRSFARVADSSTLLTYQISTHNYNGLNVFALDGGMSAEAVVEKAMENIEGSTSHTWKVSAGGGPNCVYSSSQFLKNSLQQTVDYYNNSFGATKTFDTIIIAPGNCMISYLSRVTKAPVLPVQFLVSVNSYKELKVVVDSANADGLSCYGALGYDGSVPDAGVAWIKLLDLPQIYKDFIIQHNVKNVIIAATDTAIGGESAAKKVLEPGTSLNGTNAGDIYVMYPGGGSAYDTDQLSRRIRDIREIQTETNFRNLNDWESGMLPVQIDTIEQSAKSTIGQLAQVISLTGDSGRLYDFATYAMCSFYKKNESFLSQNGPVVKGVAANPYLIAHPAYETRMGYIPALFWQFRTTEDIVDNTINTTVRNAIAAYFPNISFNSLNFWVNYSNNFGGGTRAADVAGRLAYDGLANITQNDYTRNEVWDTADGMNSPVEQVAAGILANSSPLEMKTFDSSLLPLSIQDIADIQTVYPHITVTVR